jgi:hypothetical protein
MDSACSTSDLHTIGSVILTPPNVTSPGSQTIYIKASSAVGLSPLSPLHGLNNGVCLDTGAISAVSASTPVSLQVIPVTSPITGNGQCVEVNLTAVNGSGVPENVSTSTNVFAYVFGGNQGGQTQLYPSSGCTGSPTNNFTIPSGSSSVPAYFFAQGSSPNSVSVVADDETAGSCTSSNLGKTTLNLSW